MTHKAVHANGQATPAKIRAFERHLRGQWRASGIGTGSRAEQKLMIVNIMFAHTAPFPIRAKTTVLEDLHNPADPEKSLAALNALGKMAVASGESRPAFVRAAQRWHKDITMKHVHPAEWLHGEEFIRNLSRWLPDKVRDSIMGEGTVVPKAEGQ